MGELPGRITRGCDIANDDLPFGPDAGKDGGDPQGRIQNAATSVLANLQKGGNSGVLSRFYRNDPRCHPVRGLQLLHVRHVEKLSNR